MKQSSDFLETTPVHKLIRNFSTFAIISMVATGSVSMIGALIVSRGIDVHAVGAMGILFPLTSIFFGFSQLVAIGAGSYISRLLGQKKKDVATSAIVTSYGMSFVISAMLILITLLFKNSILEFLGADGSYTESARTYLSTYIFGIPFIATTLLTSAILRAYGKQHLSTLIIVIDAVLVLGIDYVLVFVFSAGMTGVALSNAVGSLISSIIGMVLLYKMVGRTKKLKEFRVIDFATIKSVLTVGISALGRAITVSAFAFILNRALNEIAPDEVITALGTVNRIVMLILYMIMGINQAMQPVASFNYSAKNISRVKEALKFSLIYATIIGLTGMIIGYLFTTQILNLFTSSVEILDDATRIFRMQLLMYATIGIQTLTATYFQAIGKGRMSFFLSTVKPALILIPLTIIISSFSKNVDALWWMYPVADVITTAICVVILRRDLMKLEFAL